MRPRAAAPCRKNSARSGCGQAPGVGERRIEHAYVFDRLGRERLTPAYRILIPPRRRRLKSGAAAGAEAVSGLGRAFFYAGARALLVTNWAVMSDAATALVADLFPRQAADPGLGRAEALRQAMLGLIDGQGYIYGGKTVYSYAHPLFWAPYTIIGDGSAQ